MLPKSIEKTAIAARYGSKIFCIECANIIPTVTIIALNAAAFPPVENKPATVVEDPW